MADLSSNDGCVIAQNEEMKEAGVLMGALLFEWEGELSKRRVQVFNRSVWQTEVGNARADSTSASPLYGYTASESIERSGATGRGPKHAWR